MRRRYPLILISLVVFLVSGCKLDVVVDVEMANNGSGVVTVTATADAELVADRADMIRDLDFTDAIENGWEVGEPVIGADDSATVTLTHSFANADELANVLSSIGPPLSVPGVARTSDGRQVTNGISGILSLEDGYASFADSDLVAAAGGVPFAAEFDAANVPPSEGFSFTLDVHLPGRLVKAPSGTSVGDGTIRWVAPTDGKQLRFEAITAQTIGSGGSWWARPLSYISLALLVIWVVLSIGFIGYVARQRRQKARTHQLTLRNLSETRSPPVEKRHRGERGRRK